MPRKSSKKEIEFSEASCFELFVQSKKRKRINILANSFVVPDFQRGYVWKQDQVERLLEAISSKEGKYLGNVVILSSTGGKDLLVDGQQRLVTISLLCKVLKGKAQGGDLKKEITNILLRDNEPRISFSNNSLDSYYKKIIKNDLIEEAINSQKFIYSSISAIGKSSYIAKLDSDKKIKLFLQKIKTLQFGVIVCLSISEVYNLFEGLNSTGIALTSIEKTKSSILGKLHELGGDKESDKGRKIWSKIEKNFEKCNNIFWFNKFLRHHWFLIGGKVGEKKLFDEIRKAKIKTAKRPQDLFDYLCKIYDDSIIYLKLRTGKLDEQYFPRNARKNCSKDVVDLLIFINKLELEQVYPVILALYSHGGKFKEYHFNSKFYEHIRKLAAFCFLAKYGKIIPSQYETTFANLCFEIRDKKYDKNFKNRMAKFFKDLSKLIKESKKKFIKNFSQSYSDERDRFTKQIFVELFGIEGRVSAYTTEHILPRGGDGKGNFSNWTNVPPKNYKQLAGFIFRIGNLTLIEEKLNSDEAKDLGFKEKLKIYKKSKLSENENIKKYKNFNSADPSKAIVRRGKDLAGNFFDAYFNMLDK
jgi:uncharacterized protein with ParB-like and HNH nuclease domain